MANEFKKHLELLGLDEETKTKIVDLIAEAGAEYPCLACPSKDSCENFNWYTKWFSS